jgi:hypothetical protein
LAIFFAFVCRKSNDDQEVNEYLNDNQFDLENDEEYLHSIQVSLLIYMKIFDMNDIFFKKNSLFIYRPPIRANRLNEAEVTWACYQRLQEISMWLILREIFIYLCFLSILCIITYSNRYSNSFLQVNHLQKYFLNSRQINLDYSKVSLTLKIF